MKNKIYFLKNSAKILAIVALCVGYTQADAQANAYFSNDTDVPIPDNADFVGTAMEVSGIPEDHHIYFVVVASKMDHTWAGDLVMALQMPNGTTMGLMHRPGTAALIGAPAGVPANLSAENFIVFKDNSMVLSELMGDGLATNDIIPAGEFFPSWNDDEFVQDFTSLDNLSKNYTGAKNGNWNVAAKDVAAGDTGTISFVDIVIGYDRYCVPFTNNNSEHITNVTFSGINYSSGEFEYDFPDYHTAALGHGSTPVTQGQTYPISVSISPDANDFIYAYADWNQDGDFDEADEWYIIATNVGTAGPFTSNIIVPAGAMVGETRMRVSLAYQDITVNPCVVEYGETEDFTLLVEASMGVNDLMANDKTTAYPNPIVDEVNFTSKNTISQVNIYNVNGQEVMMQNANAQSLKLNVSNLPSGVYVAKIKTDKGIETIKLIKK